MARRVDERRVCVCAADALLNTAHVSLLFFLFTSQLLIQRIEFDYVRGSQTKGCSIVFALQQGTWRGWTRDEEQSARHAEINDVQPLPFQTFA